MVGPVVQDQQILPCRVYSPWHLDHLYLVLSHALSLSLVHDLYHALSPSLFHALVLHAPALFLFRDLNDPNVDPCLVHQLDLQPLLLLLPLFLPKESRKVSTPKQRVKRVKEAKPESAGSCGVACHRPELG